MNKNELYTELDFPWSQRAPPSQQALIDGYAQEMIDKNIDIDVQMKFAPFDKLQKANTDSNLKKK